MAIIYPIAEGEVHISAVSIERFSAASMCI